MLTDKGYPVRRRKAAELENRQFDLARATFPKPPPKQTRQHRDKTLYIQRREEGLQQQREHRDATS